MAWVRGWPRTDASNNAKEPQNSTVSVCVCHLVFDIPPKESAPNNKNKIQGKGTVWPSHARARYSPTPPTPGPSDVGSPSTPTPTSTSPPPDAGALGSMPSGGGGGGGALPAWGGRRPSPAAAATESVWSGLLVDLDIISATQCRRPFLGGGWNWHPPELRKPPMMLGSSPRDR